MLTPEIQAAPGLLLHDSKEELKSLLRVWKHVEMVIFEQEPSGEKIGHGTALAEQFLQPFSASFQAQHKAHQDGGIPSPTPCFHTKVNRVNSNTPHFSDKAKKLHYFNPLCILH